MKKGSTAPTGLIPCTWYWVVAGGVINVATLILSSGCDDMSGGRNSELAERGRGSSIMGAGSVTRGRYDDGSALTPTATTDSETEERRACIGNAFGALFAFAEDGLTLAGVGLAWKGVKGVRLALRAKKAAKRYSFDRLLIPSKGYTLPGNMTPYGVRHLTVASGSVLGELGFHAVTEIAAGDSPSLGELAISLLPGANFGYNAIEAYTSCAAWLRD